MHTLLVAIPPPWAQPGGAMFTKLYQFHNVSPILPILQKGCTTVSEHGDVIEMQTIIVPPQSFLANSVPDPRQFWFISTEPLVATRGTLRFRGTPVEKHWCGAGAQLPPKKGY